MNPIQNLLSDHLIQALGWTILHSLWQGAAVAVLLAVVLIVMRRNSSNARYVATISSLAALLLVSVFTFLRYYQASTVGKPQPEGLELVWQVGKQLLQDTPPVKTENWQDYFSFFTDYFAQHLPLIVSGWLLGITILMLRFLGGIAYLQRLKHYKTQAVSDFWQGTTNYLARQMKLKKTVSLLESAVVKVPMVIGWLKPVILLPIGTLNGLTARQVEIILAHELAHVYRHDYLVNILQSLVEIALFFNPFVWWISASIREERENCCDDLAIQVTNEDQLAFAQTLVSLEEMRWQSIGLVPAFLGDKGSLLGRIKRLVQQNTPNSTFSEGFISALLLVFCLTIASFNTPQPTLNQLTSSHSWWLTPLWNTIQNVTASADNEAPLAPLAPESPEEPILTDSKLRAKLDTIRFGNGFMAVTDRRGNTTLYKNGEKIDKEDFNKYKDVFSFSPGSKSIKNATGNFSLSVNGENGEHFSLNIPIPSLESLEELANLPEIPDVPLPPMSFIENGENGEFIYIDDEGNRTKIYFKNGQPDNIYYNEEWLDKNSDEYQGRLETMQKDRDKMQREFERKNQKYREELERSREKIERKREKISDKEYQKSLREIETRLRKNEEYKRSYERDLQRQNHRPHNQSMEDGFKKLIKELEKDNIIEKGATKLKLSAKNGIIKVNGSTLSGSQAQKYKNLLKKYLDWNVDDRGSSYSWSWEDDND
ncbi:MAG: M48 family metalloprotease [Microscillaceae bacterium]|jgi:beta-lactamase regulating signal transducer with metallopeptidase domain|nr:M48 family metalloprotease [Microscillaceae bacterium]